ncbi:SRPBCC family protein [Pseudonocardia sp. WMMC193]|uniref:SRPBCC family protein n=1 Tax=Pseudonocardia sp. WMMC193 TaxID=2911965 RepID=UPI001F2A91B7|nr:SRPBCC family protein [Pseudonocardia sp. WMMC193]MCF7549353.1 SRPBCC family protein [Pseudonocardia sp. WMMC193]
MELINTFSVSEPVDRAWAVITDLERVAPCLPGAALLGVDGDDYQGAVKIKVGPVTAQYEGVARFASRDDDAHHAVLRAEGRDTRGQGNAAATIDLRLHARGDGTEVVVLTDLELAGRVAQFGRGVIADVSGKLIGRFAQRLEDEMGRDSAGAAASAPSTSGAAPSRDRAVVTPARSIDDVEPLDLVSAGGGAALGLIKQNAIPIGLGLLGLIGAVLVAASRRATPSRAVPAAGPGVAPVILQLVLPSVPAAQHPTHDTPVPGVEGDR